MRILIYYLFIPSLICFSCKHTTEPDLPVQKPKIAFLHHTESNPRQDLYIMDTDGENIRNLVRDVDWDDPVFSPDGSKIAFASFANDRFPQIYTINIDGSNLVRLTNNNINDSPQFLPDGSGIIFVSARDGNGQIYIMNENGSNQRKLTDNSAFANFYPKISSDGSKIVFVSISPDTTSTDLYILDIAAGNEKRLTNLETGHIVPQFSPDGANIAFVHEKDSDWRDLDLSIIDVKGGTQSLLVQDAYGQSIEFTPDGNTIVFVSSKDYNIYTINIDSGDLTNLSQVHQSENFQRYEFSPKISPDGAMIAFTSTAIHEDEPGSDIFIMDINGNNMKNLTGLVGNETNPVFQLK